MSPAATSCGRLSRIEVEALRAAGLSASEIAERAGVGRRTMYNALSAWGLVGRRGGDHRSRAWRERITASIVGGDA